MLKRMFIVKIKRITYNFFVDLDPALTSSESGRVSVLLFHDFLCKLIAREYQQKQKSSLSRSSNAK